MVRTHGTVRADVSSRRYSHGEASQYPIAHTHRDVQQLVPDNDIEGGKVVGGMKSNWYEILSHVIAIPFLHPPLPILISRLLLSI